MSPTLDQSRARLTRSAAETFFKIRSALQSAGGKQLLLSLYRDQSPNHDDRILAFQTNRHLALVGAHLTTFRSDSNPQIFSAPGRIEICGNHTDHQGGLVVTASTNIDCIGVVAGNSSRRIVIKSLDIQDSCDFALSELAQKRSDSNLTRLVKAMHRYAIDAGIKVQGFNSTLTSMVKPGSGLSSSAALEMMLCTAINDLFNGGEVPLNKLVSMAQFGENEGWGKPSGKLDQYGSGAGGIVFIDFKNETSPTVRVEPEFASFLAGQGFRFITVETGSSHAGDPREYGRVVSEMRKIASEFRKGRLCDVHEKKFSDRSPSLFKRGSDRAVLRAAHYYSECRRVRDIEAAMLRRDLPAFLSCVVESGMSSMLWLQNAFNVTSPANQRVPIALHETNSFLRDKVTGAIGSVQPAGAYRLHGGGFGGRILVILHESLIPDYARRMRSFFGRDCIEQLGIRELGATNFSSLLNKSIEASNLVSS